MNWQNILKANKEGYPSMEEMVRELWKFWFYNDMDSFEEYEFEEYDSDPEDSQLFSKIRRELEKLDPINDSSKIGVLLRKLADHPSLPMETISYPMVGPISELDEEDVRAEYDEMRD